MSKPPTLSQTAVYNRLTELEVSNYNQHRTIVGVLGNLVTQNEVIVAAVVGRNANFTPALFALTGSRLLYIEGDKLYHSTNEITLDSIQGVSLLPTPILSSVTIQTLGGEYSIQDINDANSRYFTHELDATINTVSQSKNSSQPSTNPLPSNIPNTQGLVDGLLPANQVTLSQQELKFITNYHVGILATVSASGQIHSNPVYYIVNESKIYIMTREDTHKARNMAARPQATLVVMDGSSLQYLTISTLAKEISDLLKKEEIYNSINSVIGKQHSHIIQQALYEVDKGNYTVFELIPVQITTNLA